MNVFHKFAIRSLKLNRTRTVVTIIGIILSTAMLTAVTTTVSSVQQFLLEVTEKQNGCWHGVVSNISMKQIDEISKKKEVEKQVSIQNIGYAKLPHSKNETSPYLYIGGLNGDYETLLPFYMKEGRMPKNENEIILPASLETNAGVSYQVGDVISLPKGLRVLKNKNQLWEDDSYLNEDDETFVELGKAAYHVVGIYLNPLYDQSMSAGYYVFTKAANGGPDYGGSVPKSCIPIPHKVVFSSPDSSLFISCSISHLPFPQDLNSAPILNGTNSSPRTAPVPHHQW